MLPGMVARDGRRGTHVESENQGTGRALVQKSRRRVPFFWSDS
jgi:hypothetical protein